MSVMWQSYAFSIAKNHFVGDAMSLSLPALQALRAVVETGSYAAAARQLGLTSPGVSHHIRGLEKSYSISLFTRANGQLVPTLLCEKVCDAAERVLQEQTALERVLRCHGSLATGELSVGLGNAMPGMSLIAAFNKQYPDVPLKVMTGSFQKIMRAVLDHSVDVGILPNIPKDQRFRRKVLLSNEVIAIAHPDNDLAKQPCVTATSLVKERLIFRSEGSSTQKVVDRYFHDHGLLPTAYLTLDTRDGVYEAVANGMGIGFVWKTSSGRKDDVTPIALSGGTTQSAEVVFAPVDRDLQTMNAFFSLVDQVTLN